MENLFPVTFKYLIILFLELAVYSIFVYFVFSKTKGDVCRRWKASVLVSIITGIFIQAMIVGLGWVGWLMKVNPASFFNSLIEFLYLLIPASLGMVSLMIMPIIILGTFIAYYRFAISGDQLIEKYWMNPKIHYSESQKPPSLKF